MENIRELALKLTEEMKEAGYSLPTIWKMYIESLLPVIKNHEEHDCKYYDEDIAAERIRQVKERYDAGKISRSHCAHLINGVNKLSRLHNTGKLEYSMPTKTSTFQSNEYYENLIGEYIAHNQLHPNTRGDVIWVARRFFSWLVGNGYDTLEAIAAAEIQKFIVHCSGYMTSVSIYNVQLYTRKLCEYLYKRGLINNPFTTLLTMRVSRESKMYPPTPQEELAATLEQVDRSTIKGKRDYAVILLGAVTGLRAVDVLRLKLDNIDWQRGEIKIAQTKTGNTLVLPLTADVGEAVKDYILHGRPNSPAGNVFIRIKAPHIAFCDAWSIGYIYDTYRKKAGLPREAFDGRCFHSLRRTLGKNMVTSGVSVTTVAQVLGQERLDSAKKYISLDSEHLLECALDFSGIEPIGWWHNE